MQTETYTVIRQTWLTRRPSPHAYMWVLISFLTLVLGALLYWRGFDMSATAEQVFTNKEYWRLWTTLFAHSDFGHLAANSFLFAFLGYFLAGYYGPAAFPIAAFVFGGATNAISLLTYSPDIRLIGASGVVSWMGGMWLGMYLGINRKVSLGGRLLRSIGIFLVVFAPSETFDPQISYRTHMIGFALGVIWGILYFFSRRQEFRRAEVVETIVEQHEDFNTVPLDEEWRA